MLSILLANHFHFSKMVREENFILGCKCQNGILTIPFFWQKSVIHLKCFNGKMGMDYWCFLHACPYLSTSSGSCGERKAGIRMPRVYCPISGSSIKPHH